MNKLLLKLWVLLLVISVISFQIQRFVFNWSSDAMAVSNFNERFRRTYVMIEEVLAPFPKPSHCALPIATSFLAAGLFRA